MVVEDRRAGAPAIAGGEQQDIGRGLQHGEAADEMQVVPAGDDAVEADAEEPGGHRPGQHRHDLSPASSARVSSRNSSSSSTKPAATASAVPALVTRMSPPEISARDCPKGSVFSRNFAPVIIGPKPAQTKISAPVASTMSNTRERTKRFQIG